MGSRVQLIVAAAKTGAAYQDLITAVKAKEIHSSPPGITVDTDEVAAWVVMHSPKPVSTIKRATFMARFTDAERAAIAGSLGGLVWWLQLIDTPVIDLSSEPVKNDVANLVVLGVLTAERKAAILTT